MINYDGKDIEINEELSRRDFTGRSLKDRHITGNIYGSCFSQEIPGSEIFPDDMSGVTFYDCNLDNCVVPIDNAIIGGSNQTFKVQNDGNDWVLDDADAPTLPVNADVFKKLNLPLPDPKDIPIVKAPERVDLQKIAQQKPGSVTSENEVGK